MYKNIKSITMKLATNNIFSEMNVFLLMIVAVETTLIVSLVLFGLKRFKKFKKAEDNFVRYLDQLDKLNYRLKVQSARLKNKKEKI